MKILISTILLFILFFTAIILPQKSFRVGASYINMELGDAIPVNFGFGAAISFLYFDISSNFASGHGEYLRYTTEYTYRLDKLNVVAFNFGYNINITESSYITPAIGLLITNKIYQDDLAFSSYYMEGYKNYLLVGILYTFKIADKYSLVVGIGNIEIVKLQVSFDI